MSTTARTTGGRLTRVGRWGLALLALHTVLLFLPPIPPTHQGSSAPGYALSLVVVTLLVIEIARQAEALVEWWRYAASARLRAAVGGIILGVVGGALAFRRVMPQAFARFSREEGLWEPLTLTCFLGGAVLLWRATGAAPRAAGTRDAATGTRDAATGTRAVATSPHAEARAPRDARKPWRLMAL